jgi:hypothetical protein
VQNVPGDLQCCSNLASIMLSTPCTNVPLTDDFRIWDGKQHIIGHIEAKAPTTEYLDQVCDKWLKDRKGKRLSLDDIKHYCKVVTTTKNTIEIQKEIDILYPEIEKEFIEFKNLKNKQ